MANVELYYSDVTELLVMTKEQGRLPDYLVKIIDDERKEKAVRIKEYKNMVRSAVAGALIQIAYKEFCVENDYAYNGETELPAQLHYIYGVNGKPAIEDVPDFCFSLSHSGDYVIIAVCDRSVGIDIQEYRHQKAMKSIADNVFTEKEKAYLESDTSSDMYTKRFFQIWSAKEAYIKMTGEGLLRDFKSFDVNIESMTVIGGNGKEEGYLEDLSNLVNGDNCGYSLMMCSGTSNIEVKYRNIQF